MVKESSAQGARRRRFYEYPKDQEFLWPELGRIFGRTGSLDLGDEDRILTAKRSRPRLLEEACSPRARRQHRLDLRIGFPALDGGPASSSTTSGREVLGAPTAGEEIRGAARRRSSAQGARGELLR